MPVLVENQAQKCTTIKVEKQKAALFDFCEAKFIDFRFQ